MRTPSSTIHATFHNASVTLKVRPSLVADTLGSRSASTASRKARHKSSYGQPVFPLSTLVFKLDVSPLTIPLQSVLAHLTTALKQNMTTLGLNTVVVGIGSAEVTVQPIISARQTPGSVHYLGSISLHYGFQRTEDVVPLPALLEECHQRLLGSLLIRRYPLVFGTWKFRFAQEQQTIRSITNAALGMARRSLHPNFQSVFRGDIKKLRDSLTADGMDESTPITPREAIQQSLELLFMNQIRPRVIKLDFTNVIVNLGNLEERDKDDTGSQILGSATSSQTTVESEWRDNTMSEAEADLDLLAHDLDSDSSGAGGELLDDRMTETEPGILVF